MVARFGVLPYKMDGAYIVATVDASMKKRTYDVRVSEEDHVFFILAYAYSLSNKCPTFYLRQKLHNYETLTWHFGKLNVSISPNKTSYRM